MIRIQDNKSIFSKAYSVPTEADIFLWILPLDDPALATQAYEYLTCSEKNHLNKLRRTDTKLQYQVSHGCLRKILSSMLNIPGSELTFHKQVHGKPFLANLPLDAPSLHFNISHSQDYAAIGISSYAPIGVDIERIRPDFPAEKLAKRFFHPNEYTVFLSLPDSDRHSWFIKHWTMKESFVKALGDGLTLSTTSFEIVPKNDMENIFCIKISQKDFSSWHIQSVKAPDGYCLSVASQKP